MITYLIDPIILLSPSVSPITSSSVIPSPPSRWCSATTASITIPYTSTSSSISSLVS